MRPTSHVRLSMFLGAILFTLTASANAQGIAPEADESALFVDMEASAFRSVPVSLSDSGDQLTAELVAPSGRLDFSSAIGPTGEVVVSLTTAFDGLTTRLEAVVAADRESVTWTGNGGSLTKNSRDAIRRLLAEFEPMLQEGVLLPHQYWAFRLTNLWSEIPLSLPLARPRTVLAPERDKTISALVGAEAIAEPQGTSHIEEQAKVKGCAKGCNLSGGQGIQYLRGSCKNCGCNLGTYKSKHDACALLVGGHCYDSYNVKAGCSRSSKCVGRCGAGCGTFIVGNGPYTTDCLDHDYCVRHDNANAFTSLDKNCGDEFFEAEDDFLFAVYNCGGCK